VFCPVLFKNLLVVAGCRVVKSLGSKQEARVQIPVPLKVLGSDEIICKYLPL